MYVNHEVKNAYRVSQPEGRGAFLRLDQNENPLGLPRWIFDDVHKKITPEFLSIYPEESHLTELYAQKFGIPKNTVTLTDGSVVGMGYVIKVFGEPEKKLICATPTFGMYKVYAEMSGMDVVEVKYEKDFSFSIEAILDQIDESTGIVSLVNPNMPIGNEFSIEEIEAVVKKAEEFNALVIVDEAYYYFSQVSAINLVKKYENVVILRTFSKMLSIPALRLGVIISNPSVIKYINNYKPHYTVNSIALLFGEKILLNHDRLVKDSLDTFYKGKHYIFDRLEENKYEFIPSVGCFVCFKPKSDTPENITQKLRECGVLVLCGRNDLKEFIRVSIADEDTMKQFWHTFIKIETL